MRALVTGACGFVGGYLVRHLVECGDEVVGTFLSDPNRLQQLQTNPLEGVKFERVSLDATNQSACNDIISRVRPDVIYHLAGIAFVPEAEENFDRVLKINVGATNNIARACHLLQLKARIVFVSSAEVYGRVAPGDLPLTEDKIPSPANNYSLTKLMAELVTKRYEQAGYVTPLIMRPFNHIGPGQDHRFVASSFARQLASIALGRSEPRMMVGNLAARRDFSDVRDIIRAYRLAAVRGSGIYNLGAGRAIAVQEILDTLISISGLSVTIEQDPARMRAAEVPEVYCSFAKANRELDWSPVIPLKSSLKDIYESWIHALKSERN